MAVGVGIDIGTSSIKIAVLDGSAQRPRVVHFANHKLEGDRSIRSLTLEDLSDLIREIVAREKVPQGSFVAAMPAASALVREILVPFTRDDQIAKTVKFQAESVFHAVSIDDLIVDYLKVEELSGDRSRLCVVGIRKDGLKERLLALEGAGCDPSAVDLDAVALYNALALTPAVKEGKRVLGVDLGGATVKMVVAQAGKLRGLRSTRLQTAGMKVGGGEGGRRSSRETARPGGPVTLEDLKRGMGSREEVFFVDQGGDAGGLPVVILDEDQSELFDFVGAGEAERLNVLEKVFLEIDRTLAATRLDGALDVIYLTGGGAATDGIEKAFSEHFGIPCERAPLARALGSKLSRATADALDLSGAVALGLALKGIGFDAGGLDFRQEEFTFQGKFDRAKRGVAASLVLLFVLFFLVAYRYQIIEIRRLGTKQDYLRDYQRDIYWTLLPEEAQKPPPDDVLAALKKKERELKQKLKGFDVPDVISALDVLRDVAQGIEESGKKVLLKEAYIRQSGSTLKLEIGNELEAYAIKDAVNGTPEHPKNRLATLEEGPVQQDPKTQRVNVQFRVNLPEKKKPPRAAPKEEE